MNPLLKEPATTLARRIRDREVLPSEVVRTHLQRMRAVNGRLNAVVRDRWRAAEAEALRADQAVADGEELGPFHGVPCTIKESFAVEGMPWTAGLRARTGTIAPSDAVTVQRLRDAGAIILGVTNTSELCMWMESNNPVYGRSNNPYDPTRIVGGSSGGEGAIIGSGASPMGLGADVGGSIRMPAFFNGVFGHKPSPGLIPNSGQFPNSEGSGEMLGSGPLARSSEDLMALVEVLAGPDGEDDVCVAQSLGDVDAVRLDGMPVLVVHGNGSQKVHRDLIDAQVRAGKALARMGAMVRTHEFPGLKYSLDIWSTGLGGAEGSGAFRKLMRRNRKRDLLPHLLRPSAIGGEHTIPATVLGLIEDVSTAFPNRTLRFQELRDELQAEMIEAMGDGVILYPPYPCTAPTHYLPMLRPMSWVYTAVFNALGLPVTQVPLGLDRRGLPLGVQIVGPPGADHRTIAVARALERHGPAGWIPPSQ